VSRTEMRMASGERLDVVVDFAGKLGQTLYLRDTMSGLNLIQFRVTQDVTDNSTVPGTLRALPDIGEPTVTRTFNFDRTAGRWTITVTAESPQGRTSAQTRNVSVVFQGVNLVVTIEGGRAWLKVWVDGKLDPDLGAAGSVIANGRTLTFTGKDSVEVRSGSSGVTHFTLNGTSLGALGRPGIPETWLFAPPDPPVKTNRR